MKIPIYYVCANKKYNVDKKNCLICGNRIEIKYLSKKETFYIRLCKCLNATTSLDESKLKTVFDVDTIDKILKNYNDVKTKGFSSKTSHWINKGFSEEEAIENIIKCQKITNEKYFSKYTKSERRFFRDNCKEYWINKGFSEEEAIEKVSERQTTFSKDICIEKYGEEEGLRKLKKRKKKCNNTWNKKSSEDIAHIMNKKYDTMKKNNSFKLSIPENKCYYLLCEKYGEKNIVRQYKSKLYPFMCDFYIKSTDTYIEYQGHWTHSNEPYDKHNIEHEKTLTEWVERSVDSNFYRTAVKNWTITDPLKRKTAVDNNLKYYEFWNNKEVEKWLKLN